MCQVQNSHVRPLRSLSFAAIAVTGFASSVGQIMIIRELLVFFYGNELSTGLFFTAWLIWIAAGSALGGKLSCQIPSAATFLAIALIILALLLPATILWIRGSGLLWNIPLGELLPPEKMLGISFSATWLFCLVSGFIFPLAWSVYAGNRKLENCPTANCQLPATNQQPATSNQPVIIYLGEAIGAASGGLFFYFVLLPYVSVLASAFVTSGFILAGSALLLWSEMRQKQKPGYFKKTSCCLWLFIFILMATGLFFISKLDNLSRRWQWGRHLVTVRDTPYHNLALIRHENLCTIFANGLWYFSVPDPQSAETAVHLALLQHPHPRRVLLISGGVAGFMNEILKHPNVSQVDYIEPDPELIMLAEEYLPGFATESLQHNLSPFLKGAGISSPPFAKGISDVKKGGYGENPRAFTKGGRNLQSVRMFHEDAGTFIRQTDHMYDVILMNVGDPMNAQMNRFYTSEFYQQVKKRLNPGGIFSFAVSSSPDMLGSAQVQFLRSVFATIHEVFPQVTVYPGENARFFATGQQGKLIMDPDEIITRIADRNLQLKYIQEYYLFDILDPFRLDYFKKLLAEEGKIRHMVNRDFTPTCYFYNLVLWGTQLNKGFKKFFIILSEIRQWWLWAGMAAVLCMSGTLTVMRLGHVGAAGLCVMVVGGMQMALQIVIILSFQILAGFVYKQLALIIAFFMAGMALGTGMVAWVSKYENTEQEKAALRLFRICSAQTWFVLVQAVICIYLISTIGLLFFLQNYLQTKGLITVGWIFSGLALIGGILGGTHFSLAVKTVSGAATPSVKTGGGLYALDIAGSAGGALMASLFLLPLYGVTSTLMFFSLTGFGSLLVLIVAYMKKN